MSSDEQPAKDQEKAIIVVDDDYNSARLIKMILELDGLSTAICSGGRQAWARAGDGVRAFIIDLYLAQGESGIELLKEIRSGGTPAPASIPVVIVSGDARREQEAISFGADSFLVKPYSPIELSSLVKELIDKERNGG